MAKLVESQAKTEVRDVRDFEENRVLTLAQAARLEATLDEMINQATYQGDLLGRDEDVRRRVQDAYAVRVIFRLGLRRFEFCKARCGDVEVGKFRVVGKGKLKDFVPLTGPASETLSAWLDWKRELKESTEPKAFLFCGRRSDEPMSFGNLRLRWKQVLLRAGLLRADEMHETKYGLHTLRHTAGLLVYAKTGDLGKTARFLRHRDTATTSRFYLHIDSDKLREELSSIETWKTWDASRDLEKR